MARLLTTFALMVDLSVHFIKKQVIPYFTEFFQIFWKILQ